MLKKMKRWRYLGGRSDIEYAVFLPCMVVGPVIFACSMFTTGIDGSTIFLAIICVICSIITGTVMWKHRSSLYAWGNFQKDAVYVKVLFDEIYPIYYEKCKSIGIGGYLERGLTSRDVGFTRLYIFFSYDPFNEKYRGNINMVDPSPRFITLGFSKRRYEYLLTILPPIHADVLRHDYEMMQRYKQEAKDENKRQKKKKKKRKK